MSEMFIAIAGIILAFIGIAVSFYLTKSSRPLFAIRSNSLQGVDHPDLIIQFRDIKIPNVYSIRFVMWNAGRKEIRSYDLPALQAGPRLKFADGTKLLFYKATTTTGDNSGQLIEGDMNELYIRFDYLNNRDAILGEILCTTNNNSSPNANIIGNFKGSTLKQGDIVNASWGDQIFFIIVALGFAYLGAIVIQETYQTFMLGSFSRGLVGSFFSLIIFFVEYLLIRFNILSIPNKIPKKFKHFLDNGSLQ